MSISRRNAEAGADAHLPGREAGGDARVREMRLRRGGERRVQVVRLDGHRQVRRPEPERLAARRRRCASALPHHNNMTHKHYTSNIVVLYYCCTSTTVLITSTDVQNVSQSTISYDSNEFEYSTSTSMCFYSMGHALRAEAVEQRWSGGEAEG